eukprot:3685865-Rhodomonas_salina.1
MYIRPLEFEVRYISQESPFPCDPANVIAIQLTPTIDVRTDCWDSDWGAFNRTAAFTFSGLNGAVTASDSALLLSQYQSVTQLPTMGSTGDWQNPSRVGSLTVTPS